MSNAADPKMKTTRLKSLYTDEEARAIVHAANVRNSKYGCGDTMDLLLFVVDETRRRIRKAD